jgi:Rrf2 family transcriptional regulator, iron-sulfur cluster assembly transcription factor
MFSKSCEYAIKAVIHLGSSAHEKKLFSLISVANAIDSPSAYTAKILQQLSKAGIIRSTKGHLGGYYVEESHLKKLYLSDIVNVIDGDNVYTSCALGLKKCSAHRPCPLHENFKGIRNELKLMLENTTIQDLVEGINKNGLSLK